MIQPIIEKLSNEILFSPNDRDEIKIASLLHDVGYGFFSHTSERIMKIYNVYEEEKNKKEFNPLI